MQYVLLTVCAFVAGASAQGANFCFTSDETRECEILCPLQTWSLFEKSVCQELNADEKSSLQSSNNDVLKACQYVCQKTNHIWNTVFIIVVWAAAVTIIVLMFPMCISSCASCLTVKKVENYESRRRREADQMDMAGPGKAGGSQQGTMVYGAQNPYAYWPYYGRM